MIRTISTTAILLFASVVSAADLSPRVPKPYERGSLRAFVNADDAAACQDPLNMGGDALVTDATYFARGVKDFYTGQGINSANDVFLALVNRMPSALIGRYHSSRFVLQKDAQLYQWVRPDGAEDDDPRLPGIGRIPTEHYVQAERFAPEELLPSSYNHPLGMRAVDFRQPATRAKLVGFVVDDALRMGALALMTDEWAPSATWDGGEPWIDSVIAYETQLTKALHAHGIAHFANMHFRVGGLNDFDGTKAPRLTAAQLTAIASNCDCLLLERPCDAQAQPADIVADYQVIAKTGTPCVMMGADPTFEAGLSMLTSTKDGPLNYVATAVWEAEPRWKWLSARLGPPLMDAKWVDKVTASRVFQRGKVICHFDTMQIEIK